MSRRQRSKRKGPATAIGLLIVSAGIAAFSLNGRFGAGTEPADVVGAFLADEPVGDESTGDAPEDVVGVDLLLRHGSWSAQVPVRMAFANAVDAAVAAAPAGETAAPAARPWIGADPPQLRLGVLMVSDSVRRAVVDGRVVGVGDTVGKALIVAIERDAVTTTWGGKRLTYDLDGDHPREFRAELKRRGIDPSAAPTTGTADPIQEQNQ